MNPADGDAGVLSFPSGASSDRRRSAGTDLFQKILFKSFGSFFHHFRDVDRLRTSVEAEAAADAF